MSCVSIRNGATVQPSQPSDLFLMVYLFCLVTVSLFFIGRPLLMLKLQQAPVGYPGPVKVNKIHPDAKRCINQTRRVQNSP